MKKKANGEKKTRVLNLRMVTKKRCGRLAEKVFVQNEKEKKQEKEKKNYDLPN